MNGLRRVAWGTTLMPLAPLFWVLAPVPLVVGLALLAWGSWRASGRVEAFRVAAWAAAACALLLGLSVWVMLAWSRPTWVQALFSTTAALLGVVYAAVGEGAVRMDGRLRGRVARLAGWMVLLGALVLAAAGVADALGDLDAAFDAWIYGVFSGLLVLGAVLSVAALHAVARGSRTPQADPSPLPSLPD